jgi:hypothetical protein
VATEADALTDAYMRQITSIRERVVAFATVLWQGSPSLRDADVDRIVSRIVPAVQGGQLQVANITNAYVQRLAALEGVTVSPESVARDVIDYRGVPADEVYRRPAVTTYTSLSAGNAYDDAAAAGLARMVGIVRTDVQQTRNRQAARAYGASGFDYTLRVLSGAENCALCVIASTQRYLKSDLQPIHPGCDCGERGVRANRDPGQVIDPDLLELAHDAIEKKLGIDDRGARDLGRGKQITYGDGSSHLADFTDLIVVREHGELGPTLVWRDEKFTSAGDIDALN